MTKNAVSFEGLLVCFLVLVSESVCNPVPAKAVSNGIVSILKLVFLFSISVTCYDPILYLAS